MRASVFVGRVGGLALALGVGLGLSVVCGGPVWAAPDEGSADSATSAEAPGSGAGAVQRSREGRGAPARAESAQAGSGAAVTRSGGAVARPDSGDGARPAAVHAAGGNKAPAPQSRVAVEVPEVSVATGGVQRRPDGAVAVPAPSADSGAAQPAGPAAIATPVAAPVVVAVSGTVQSAPALPTDVDPGAPAESALSFALLAAARRQWGSPGAGTAPAAAVTSAQAVSPTSNLAPRAYVTNFASNSVSVVDTATNTVVRTISDGIGIGPAGVAVNPAGTLAFVPNIASNTVSVINTATSVVSSTVSVGKSPVGVAFSADGTRAYVSNAGDGTVSVIDVAAAKPVELRKYTVGTGPGAVVVAGTKVYVANNAGDSVSAIDTVSNTVQAIAEIKAPAGLALNPAGTLALVTSQLEDAVSVIDIAKRQKLYDIPVGQNPSSLAINAAGTRAYVANYFDGAVSVIDIASTTAKVIATIGVGAETAHQVAVTSVAGGDLVYVTTPKGVTVINTAENYALSYLTTGTDPAGVAFGGSSTVAATPTLRIANASIVEGQSGTKTLVFEVTLSATPTAGPVTVNWATKDGTAVSCSTCSGGDLAGKDFAAGRGLLTFAKDTTSLTQGVGVTLFGDSAVEADETFTVTLSSPSGATLGTATATGTIRNDDVAAPPVVSVANASVVEGNGGSAVASFVVSLSRAATAPVTVRWATANGTATAGSDYTAGSGTVTFAAGVTSQTVAVNVTGDTAVEADETFTVTLSSPSGATLGTATATGTIRNDDATALPTLTISGISSVPEGNSGFASANFDVFLSAASATPVTVQYVTGISSVSPATAGEDYVAITTPKTLTFNPGETRKTAQVSVIGDTKVEPDERFTVTLSNPSGATIARATADATIRNDDSPPVVSLSPATLTVDEGNTGTTKATLTVALANGAIATSDVTVNYATTAGTAKADTDFVSIPVNSPESVTILKGSNSATFYVRVIGDYAKESDETFTVALTSASLATLGAAKSATVTIRNDDVAGNINPVVSIAGVSVDEGNSGTRNAEFTVSLSRPSTMTVSVKWATADGTAKASSDYTAASGTLTFAAGVTSQTVKVAVRGDTAAETDETFTVELSSPSDLTLGTYTATGTIRNDDFPVVSLSPAAVNVTEGNSGTTNAVFTVSLSRAAASPVTVKWATNNGTATAGSDYTSGIGTLTFAPGVTSQTFSVAVAGDTATEPDETFTVELVQPVGLTFGSTTRSTVTIRNDDASAPSFTVSPSATTLNEGQTLTTTVRAGSAEAGTTLYWRVEQKSAGGGVAADDFSAGALQGSGVLERTTTGSLLSVSHTLSMDWSEKRATPETDEQFRVSFYADPAFQRQVATTPFVTVANTARAYGATDWQGASFVKLLPSKEVKAVDFGGVSFTSKFFKYYGNPTERETVILEQPWVPGRPTIVYAHGWKDSPGYRDTSNPSSGLDPNSSSQRLFNALHERYGATHNILLVDWKELAANSNYPGVEGKQPFAEITVTKQVGETVGFALLQAGVKPSQLTLIGHSLGSHVMNAAAQFIRAREGQPIAELVGLDIAWGVGYDIDARNGVDINPFSLSLAPPLGVRDPAIQFSDNLAVKTRSYTASDLVPATKIAGDNALAATAQRSYLVQYSPTDLTGDPVAAIAGYHNGVIGVYADLVRKGIEDPDNYWDVDFDNSFETNGYSDQDPNDTGMPFIFDGVIVAPQPWEKSPGGFLVPKAIGWTNGHTGITIYGSPKGDVMFHDRFNSVSISSAGTRLLGGPGDDYLVGGDPSDNRGIDELFGNEGSDTFVFGYRRYGDNQLPYRDKWFGDVIGSGLDSYAVIMDFNPQVDKLLLGISKDDLRFRKADDIDATLKAKWGDGVGLLYSNGDLFAYIPKLSFDAASAFLNGGFAKTRYETRNLFNLDRASTVLGADPTLFQDYPEPMIVRV